MGKFTGPPPYFIGKHHGFPVDFPLHQSFAPRICSQSSLRASRGLGRGSRPTPRDGRWLCVCGPGRERTRCDKHGANYAPGTHVWYGPNIGRWFNPSASFTWQFGGSKRSAFFAVYDGHGGRPVVQSWGKMWDGGHILMKGEPDSSIFFILFFGERPPFLGWCAT